MKKTLEYSVWIAIVAAIAIVTYQWRWFSPLSITNIVAVESATTPQQSAIYKPSWSVELATNTLAISENSQYSLPLNIYGIAVDDIEFRSSSIEGIRLARDNKNIIISVDKVNFSTATLTLIFQSNHIRQAKQLTLINETSAKVSEASTAFKILDNNYEMASLSGTLSFDRLTFIESEIDDVIAYHFNPDQPSQQPLRFMRLNLRDSDDQIVASTYTDEFGYYDFSILATDDNYQLEVLSQMITQDNHENSTLTQVINPGSAYPERTNQQGIYFVRSEPQPLFPGNNEYDMHLTTGWHFTLREFEPQYSYAQPFAILDTLAKGFNYLSQQDIAVTPEKTSLTVHWSQDPQITKTSTGSYSSKKNRIYISGTNALDTQQLPISTISEWNEHTILHEFGHYYMQQIVGRDDSQAGHHTAFGFGSLTLAFSEGVASALAKTVLQNWHDKRVSFDADKKRFVVNTQAIIHQSRLEKQRQLKNINGELYQRPSFDYSPFIEQTISYFILSIIDPNAPYSLRTNKLFDVIGFNGFHQSMLNLTDDKALTTIYSLAHQLKQDHPHQQLTIDDLGQQLDLLFDDQWGNNQLPLDSHIIGSNQHLLSGLVQYPFYLTLSLDKPNDISFNGALQSISKMRPGTLRYLQFTAPHDGIIEIIIPDIIEDGIRHQFSFNILSSGQRIASSKNYKEQQLQALAFRASQDDTYVIRVFDQAYQDNKQIADQIITTKVTAYYRR
ncbi:hypothetical protein ACMAZF_03375 [Psychrobium sp. nBUS_13]|uniref:hypothetical protein n=1 Tax=Psychrobium sp. nBUS_13 TaxID=3395319 RepID=UPI003EC02C26